MLTDPLRFSGIEPQLPAYHQKEIYYGKTPQYSLDLYGSATF